MASILRHRRRANFTVLPNEALRDPTLSFRATGLLAYLLSLPDGSAVDSLALSRRKKEGRDAIRTAFAELENACYVRRSKERNESNQWQTITEISDQPMGLPPDLPTPDNQAPETRLSGDQALRAKNLEQEPGQRPPLPPKGGEVEVLDAGFEAFYAAYPRKAGKPNALKAWKGAMKRGITVEQITTGLAAWLPYWEAKGEPDKVPHPSTFLNQDRFNDPVPAVRKSSKQMTVEQRLADKHQRLFGGEEGTT